MYYISSFSFVLLKASKQNRPITVISHSFFSDCCIFLTVFASQGVQTMAILFFPWLISSRSFLVTLTLRYLVPLAAKASSAFVGDDGFCTVPISAANDNGRIKKVLLKTLNQKRRNHPAVLPLKCCF